MNFIENFKVAIFNIWLNKTRSFLTVLGIVIGVSAVITLIALGQGARNQIVREYESLGSDLIFVSPGKVDYRRGMRFNPLATIGGSTLTKSDLERVKKDCSSVKYVIPLNLVSGVIMNKERKESPLSMTIATNADFVKIRNLRIQEGRVFNSIEEKNKEKVCVLGKNTAEDLFNNQKKIGETIYIRNIPFKVIGVLDQSSAAFKMFGIDMDSVVYIPFDTGSEILGSENIMRIFIQAKNSESIDKAVEEIKKAILANHHNNEDFSVIRQEDVLSILNTILAIITSLISGIAAISLIVGGIGIMNIMLVSVSERIKEIGLRKAVGATNNDILLQFLSEAICLSFLGGIIGIGLSMIIVELIPRFIDFHPQILSYSIILAFGISFLVGIIFGVAPAIKASRLDPIEALRHE